MVVKLKLSMKRQRKRTIENEEMSQGKKKGCKQNRRGDDMNWEAKMNVGNDGDLKMVHDRLLFRIKIMVNRKKPSTSC